MKQTALKLVLMLSMGILAIHCQAQDCDFTNYIIPYDALDDVFDGGISAVRSQADLVALVEEPNIDNVKTYLLSLAPFSAPLFVMAGVSLIILIASITQVICFNTCSKECCGNEINSSTYNICCLRVMIGTYLTLSFLLLGLSVGAMIVNSDLQQAIDYTSCNTRNVIEETYDGNTNSSIPWSGINNFQEGIDIFVINIQDAVPFLLDYFSPSNTAYSSVIDQTAGSSYANSQIFPCVDSSETITCPFPTAGFCTTPYNPLFNVDFCVTTTNGSAANLINAEMQTNSSTWRSTIQTIGSTLSTISTNPNEIETLVTNVTTFTSQVGNYEETLLNGFSQAQTINNNIEIAFYVFYSFVILCSLIGLTSICCVYYCLSYKCRYFTYLLWYVYALLSILFFVGAGLFLGGSIFTYDTCSAYPYYFANETNFNTLDFSSAQQLGDIFQTCFYPTDNTTNTSMFAAFTNSAILTEFGELKDQYILASPSPYFTTVVTKIEDELNNYRLNPNLVVISLVDPEEQPSVAMDELNTFGNSSLANTTQSCQATNDFFTFDVANCYPYLINQSPPDDTCVVLFSPNLTNIVTERVNYFNSKGCGTDATTYQDRVNALNAYGVSIDSMIADLNPLDATQTSPLQQYENNYFQYYTDVYNFFNSEVQQNFASFFEPYNSLQESSSCGFITVSMNAIVNIACNQLFPYVNTFSAINIACSLFIFVLFLLSYFLTTRFQFYEFLEGNYDNFGAETKTTKELQQAYDFDTGRQIQLLPNGDRIY